MLLQTILSEPTPVGDVLPHRTRAGPVAARTRYVFPRKRSLPFAMMANSSSSGSVSETPLAKGAPSNVVSLPRTRLSRLLYHAPSSVGRPWSISMIPQPAGATVTSLPVTWTSWETATVISAPRTTLAEIGSDIPASPPNTFGAIAVWESRPHETERDEFADEPPVPPNRAHRLPADVLVMGAKIGMLRPVSLAPIEDGISLACSF
jgi:hypothetical protein